ncbi:MAG: hypothetical protein WB822_08825 [Rhodoplanes sp.]
MIALILLTLNLLAAIVKSKSRLEAENAALRQQLIVLQRKVRGRVRFSNTDRLFFVRLYRWFPSILKAMLIIRPETLVRWVSRLLALEVLLSGRQAADRPGVAGVDPANETREPALGCAAPGKIDDVRLYSRALSAAEVQQLYNMGR